MTPIDFLGLLYLCTLKRVGNTVTYIHLSTELQHFAFLQYSVPWNVLLVCILIAVRHSNPSCIWTLKCKAKILTSNSCSCRMGWQSSSCLHGHTANEQGTLKTTTNNTANLISPPSIFEKKSRENLSVYVCSLPQYSAREGQLCRDEAVHVTGLESTMGSVFIKFYSAWTVSVKMFNNF